MPKAMKNKLFNCKAMTLIVLMGMTNPDKP